MRPRVRSRYVPFVRWRPVVVDVVVGMAAFGLSMAVLARSDPSAADLRQPDAAAYVLLAVYSLTAILRRRVPVGAVVGGLAAGLVYAAAQYPVALTPVVLLSIYTAASVLPQRRARLVLAGSVVVGIMAATVSPGPTDPGVPALIVCAWLLGNYIGSRRRYTAELEAKNHLLEMARVELADRAVTEERLRIARELHDVVAHSMSVVAVHAGTGRMVAVADPAGAQQALETIEVTTRAALQEMRNLLGVLRSADESDTSASWASSDLAPAPGLGNLDALVAEVVRSGVTVDVRVDGDRRVLPPGLDLTAYRIVQ